MVLYISRTRDRDHWAELCICVTSLYAWQEVRYFTLKNVEDVVHLIRGQLGEEEKEEKEEDDDEEEEEDHWASLGDVFVRKKIRTL